jgi:type IV pilus assembly protein PilC
MHSYTFNAKTHEGTRVCGTMTAEQPDTVVEALKRKGYYVLGVVPQGRLTGLLHLDAGFGRRVGVKDSALFTHQLATLLKAGVQLSRSLAILSRQTQNKFLASVIGQVRTDVEQSSSLSQAMARHPRAFAPVYTAIVEAAQQSGSLPDSLTTLGSQLKMQASIRARIRGAMVYPIFLLFVSALVVGVLTAFVIPKFIKLFVDVNQKLPVPTKILVGLTHLIKGFWWVVPLVVIGLLGIGLFIHHDPRLRRGAHRWLLALPLIGTLDRKLQVARFARTLGSLLNGGVPILKAVRTTKGATDNLAFRSQLADIEAAVTKGSTLARAMAEQSSFGEVAANMVAVGEDTGALPDMLLEVAEMYDQECETSIGALTSLLGPAMIVTLGLLIGFVVLAILLPIFETSTMVR